MPTPPQSPRLTVNLTVSFGQPDPAVYYKSRDHDDDEEEGTSGVGNGGHEQPTDNPATSLNQQPPIGQGKSPAPYTQEERIDPENPNIVFHAR